MAWFSDPANLFRLVTVAMADYEPAIADAAYLFGHTPDNEGSILRRGLLLYRAGMAERLVLCGGGPYRPPNAPPNAQIAYSGFPAWQEWLIKHGVRENNIVELPRPELSHTATEAQRFVRLCKGAGGTNVYIVACPMHMLRAFTATITFVLRDYPQLRVYAKPGMTQPWNEKVLSSQGTVEGDRLNVGLGAEWDRLNRVYGNEYDLVSCEEVLDYIRWRNSQ